jgi:hypothetical protein
MNFEYINCVYSMHKSKVQRDIERIQQDIRLLEEQLKGRRYDLEGYKQELADIEGLLRFNKMQEAAE